VRTSLGIEPNRNITTAWSNPVITRQLHNSHIETLTALCAKKFEWEFIAGEKTQGGSNQAAAMGIASHRVIEELIVGKLDPKVTLGKSISDNWDNTVRPALDAESDEGKLYDTYYSNTVSAVQWALRNIDIRRSEHEKPWIINPAADVIAGIAQDWSLAGTLDVVEFNPQTGTARIFDFKFRERFNFERNTASSQPAVYGLALQYHGWQPEFAFIETVRGETKVQVIPLTPGKIAFVSEKIRDAIRMIESGVFPMHTGGWWCSQRYCRWWDICRGKFESDNG
jgi:hypothetical protein